MCCIAREGHKVLGIDVNAEKVAGILIGQAPIKEPEVDTMLTEGLARGLIHAVTSAAGELDDCDMAIVCVGTPSGADGGHDMRYIIDVTRQIAGELKPGRAKPLTVAFRSTIRLGDATDQLVELVYNPEFLREASAVHDYFHPPKIVVGTRDAQPSANMDALHANLDAPVFYVGYRESEITKFVDNTWHAVKVAYANEIGRVCMALGISATKVHEIFVSDTKLNISAYYTRPGGAFGGSCLPKDVRALQRISADSGANTYLVDSLIRSNEAHKFAMFRAASEGLAPGAKVLVAGLAFKAKTDDLRESPNVDLVRMLLGAGFDVLVFDPAVDAAQLVGANLGYVYTRIPRLEALLISAEDAEAGDFDRIIITNATGRHLRLPPDKCLDIATIR